MRKEKPVEQEKTNGNKMLSSNRSLSIILLAISSVLIIVSLKVIIDFIVVNTQSSNLIKLKNQYLEEREEFSKINSHLGDEHYYDIYVREEYQFQGDNVIRVPR